jgi:hypothetical protein
VRASILAAAGKGQLCEVLLKQTLVSVRPARCAPAMLPALRAIGDRQPLCACRHLAFDDAEMTLRLGLRDLHARKRETAVRQRRHRTGHNGKADSAAV